MCAPDACCFLASQISTLLYDSLQSVPEHGIPGPCKMLSVFVATGLVSDVIRVPKELLAKAS